MNLAEALAEELDRNKDLLAEYESIGVVGRRTS